MRTRAPDAVEPVVGWRAWRVDTDPRAARLTSVTGRCTWPEGRALEAACHHLRGLHPAPWPGCRCGIHAARWPRGAAGHITLPSRAAEHLVFGLVALWGDVVEGDLGWRASHAFPRHLVLLPPATAAPRDVVEVAFGLAGYGVPVEIDRGPRCDVVARWRGLRRTGDPHGAGRFIGGSAS